MEHTAFRWNEGTPTLSRATGDTNSVPSSLNLGGCLQPGKQGFKIGGPIQEELASTLLGMCYLENYYSMVHNNKTVLVQ